MEGLSAVQTWLYDNLPVGVAILDAAMTYRYSNAAYSATQGYATGQLLGHKLSLGQADWTALLGQMTEQARESRRAAEQYDVPLIYPRQPSLQRTWDVTVLPIFDGERVDGYVVYLLDVTNRQQAEQLRASETRLRSVLAVAADAILVIDEDGVIQQANPATSRIFGYAEDELLGHPVTTIMPSAYGEEHSRFVARYLHTDIPHIIGTVRDVQGRRKDGTVFPCELSVAESREHGTRRIFVGILRDVTERKQSETAMERLYRQNELILHAAGEGIFGLDREGYFVFVNPAAAQLTGYSVEELIGHNCHEIIHHSYPDGTPYPLEKCPIRAAYTVGETHQIANEVFWRKDGTAFDVLYLSTPIREEGELAGAVVTFNDISERRRLEDELESARARLEAILNTVPLPLFVIDSNGDISRFNQAARDFYGELLLRNELFQMTRLRPDTRAPWPSYDWPIVRALREAIVIHDVEQIVVFPDGREVPILVHAAPIVVEGHVIAAVGVAQDLTQLKAADRAKDAFLALISHELKSPLTAIISWASLGLDEEDLRREALDVVLRSARAQQRIIDDLLDLSRVMYGKLRVEKETVDAWEVAARAGESLRTAIEERKISLIFSPPQEPLPVLADPVRLGQVFTNLLTNAMKFTPVGGAITLAGARDAGMAKLSVQDTGAGIPPEQLPFVFQRFQQLGRERISGGLGLGLAIVKALIELHGGRVEAYSAGLEQGSTFTVWLPLLAESDG
ncbi:MAG TPA: PAS domain S-box protein [Armatimonadota bacterium]|jgi:PAS domain S-box-containing protein